MSETPLFFSSVRGERLFGVIHEPEIQPLEEGFVFCHALAEEKLWSHRVLVAFARLLASRGHVVLRFDMAGEGDSEGRFEEMTIDTRLEDIATARAWLAARFGELTNLSLLGLRLGATLAQLSAIRDSGRIGRLILWEPIISGAAYAQDLLRAHLANQMAVFGRVSITRNQLVAQLEAGEFVNVEGYGITNSLYQTLRAIKLDESVSDFDRPTLIMQVGRENQPLREDIARFEQAHPHAVVDTVAEQPFWRETRFFFGQSIPLYRRTIHWMENGDG